MEAREPLQGQLALGNHGQNYRLPSPGRKGAAPLVLLSQTCPPYSSERIVGWEGTRIPFVAPWGPGPSLLQPPASITSTCPPPSWNSSWEGPRPLLGCTQDTRPVGRPLVLTRSPEP